MRFNGFQVLASSLFLAVARVYASSQLWYPIKANGTTLASGTSFDLGVRTLMTCAIHATHSAHLFCYYRNTCSHSDVKLPAGFDDSIYGPAVSCWTKYATKCIPPFDTSSGLGCFYYSPDFVDFDTAQATCQDMRADLAVPHDALAFFDWIQATLNDTDIWVGARSQKWLNGRPIAVEWEPGKPDGDTTECVRMQKQRTDIYRLNDMICNVSYSFVCEIK